MRAAADEAEDAEVLGEIPPGADPADSYVRTDISTSARRTGRRRGSRGGRDRTTRATPDPAPAPDAGPTTADTAAPRPAPEPTRSTDADTDDGADEGEGLRQMVGGGIIAVLLAITIFFAFGSGGSYIPCWAKSWVGFTCSVVNGIDVNTGEAVEWVNPRTGERYSFDALPACQRPPKAGNATVILSNGRQLTVKACSIFDSGNRKNLLYEAGGHIAEIQTDLHARARAASDPCANIPIVRDNVRGGDHLDLPPVPRYERYNVWWDSGITVSYRPHAGAAWQPYVGQTKVYQMRLHNPTKGMKQVAWRFIPDTKRCPLVR